MGKDKKDEDKEIIQCSCDLPEEQKINIMMWIFVYCLVSTVTLLSFVAGLGIFIDHMTKEDINIETILTQLALSLLISIVTFFGLWIAFVLFCGAPIFICLLLFDEIRNRNK